MDNKELIELTSLIASLEAAKVKADQAKKEYYEADEARKLLDPRNIKIESRELRIKVLEKRRDLDKAIADKKCLEGQLKLRLEGLIEE